MLGEPIHSKDCIYPLEFQQNERGWKLYSIHLNCQALAFTVCCEHTSRGFDHHDFVQKRDGETVLGGKAPRNERVRCPESNNIVAGMLLIGNISMNTSGDSRASSAETWLTRAWR